MTPLTPERVAELRAIAEPFSEWKWKRATRSWDYTEYEVIEGGDGEVIASEPIEFRAYDSGAFITPQGINGVMDHIAAFDPPTVLALLDELEQLRGVVRDLAAKEPFLWDHDDNLTCACCEESVRAYAKENIRHKDECPYRRAVEASK